MMETPFERHLPFVDERTLSANEEVYLYIKSDEVWGLRVPADSGYLINDGPGELEVRVSDDGEHYTKVQTVKSGEPLWLENDDDIWAHTVHVVADSVGAAYRSAFARSRW